MFSLALQAVLGPGAARAEAAAHAMTATPVICFGQQPCGFFPRRFLFAKISDGPAAPGRDRRRDRLLLPRQRPRLPRDPDHAAPPQDRRAVPAQFRLRQPDPAQVLAALPQARLARLARQHRRTSCRPTSTAAGSRRSATSPPTNVADFCLEMYRRMGLLEGIRVARSSDPAFRRAACDVDDYYRRRALRGRDRAGPARRRPARSCTRAATVT